MAGLHFDSDIISPLRSDISLNDNSVFSFGSLPSTPDFNIESSVNKFSELDSDIDSSCKREMKETANAYEMVLDNIKKQSGINAEREQKFKGSFDVLRQSMDELLSKKASESSILSHTSNDLEERILNSKINVDKCDKTSECFKAYKEPSVSESKLHSQASSNKVEKTKKSLVSETKSSQNPSKKTENSKKLPNSVPETNSQILNKKTEKYKKGDSANIGKKNANLKNINSSKSTTNDNIELDAYKPKNPKVAASSTQTSKSFEDKLPESSVLKNKKDEGRSKNVKSFQFKSQQKIPESNVTSAVENQALSIEKSIQIAVDMQMDSMRLFILDQNIGLRKEILKLQDAAKKQREDTKYLFSVIDELLDMNRKLISKNK